MALGSGSELLLKNIENPFYFYFIFMLGSVLEGHWGPSGSTLACHEVTVTCMGALCEPLGLILGSYGVIMGLLGGFWLVPGAPIHID